MPGLVILYRDRPVAENLYLFRRMRAGEFADGEHVLRAKIDMESPNQNMRDPVMYRIKREHHHRTGDAWCIYPMYDFAHGYSDAIEGVTHSICTLEFENHRPLRVVIENYPEGQEESLEAPWHPEDASHGTRGLAFSRVLFIDRDDFVEVPPKGWFRLSPGAEVRLRYACIIKCQRVVKDDRGNVVELRCTWDPDSRGGNPKDGRKVKGTLHWVSEKHAAAVEVRLYDRLFKTERPGEEGDDFLADLTPDSHEVLREARVEPALASAPVGDRVQFERVGYFCVDKESRPGKLVFNRTISLRDSWAAKQGK